MKHVLPSTRETAFNCPHCGALIGQKWHDLTARAIPGQNGLPGLPDIWDFTRRESVKTDECEDPKMREQRVRVLDRLVNGCPVLGSTSDSFGPRLLNVFVAQCDHCKDLSVWVHEKLVYPPRGEAQPANPDLPEDIRRDYEEASSILDLSPRGAAALLRLAIQKLCKNLGQPGKDLNKDIGALVSDGLDDQVQMDLDVVRVIGDNAAHPGQMDLRDDRATAETLFTLLNQIADRTITPPIEFKRMEIIDWWENERYRVHEECKAAAERITNLAVEKVEELSDYKLQMRNRRARKRIQEQVDTEVEEFNRAMESSLQDSVRNFIAQVERSSRSSGLNDEETELSVAEEVDAAGAGEPAALLGLRKAAQKRLKRGLEQNIAQQLLAEADGKIPNSSWACFKKQIDDVVRIRMDNLK